MIVSRERIEREESNAAKIKIGRHGGFVNGTWRACKRPNKNNYNSEFVTTGHETKITLLHA